MRSIYVPELQFSGEERTPRAGGGEWVSPIATAQDYGRYAAAARAGARCSLDLATARDYAAAMNAGTADDTEFIADGPVVTAYVHQLAHMSATVTPGAPLVFAPDEGRPYPGAELRDGPLYWHDVPGFDPATHDYAAELDEGALCTCGDVMDTAETGRPWRDAGGTVHRFSGQVMTYAEWQARQS